MTHLRKMNDVAELIGLKKKVKERQVEMKSTRQEIKALPADDEVVKGHNDITRQRERVRREIDESNGKIESLGTFIKQVSQAFYTAEGRCVLRLSRVFFYSELSRRLLQNENAAGIMV